jgi:hypothetical protein
VKEQSTCLETRQVPADRKSAEKWLQMKKINAKRKR